MREDPAPAAQGAPDGTLGAEQLLELVETAWERSRDAFDSAPVSPTQTRVMYVVEREPGINMRDLGRRLTMAAPSVSRLCDRLQATGFLSRNPRVEDRREIQLRLTDVGRAHLRELRRRRERFLRQAMGDMTPAECRAFATGLTAFCEVVGGSTQSAGRTPDRRHTA
ncbi:MarR family winged helix-turn-helix transcriptional regulator [Streptomyces clavifer]|uniref:MarR family winged helix-turn-helix transcriptional regulator n=1 Tax=Streptomyces clavifer TaxID=68188 RepID=UPI0037A22AC4